MKRCDTVRIDSSGKKRTIHMAIACCPALFRSLRSFYIWFLRLLLSILRNILCGPTYVLAKPQYCPRTHKTSTPNEIGTIGSGFYVVSLKTISHVRNMSDLLFTGRKNCKQIQQLSRFKWEKKKPVLLSLYHNICNIFYCFVWIICFK